MNTYNLEASQDLLKNKYPYLDLKIEKSGARESEGLFITSGAIWVVKIEQSRLIIRPTAKVGNELLCVANDIRDMFFKKITPYIIID